MIEVGESYSHDAVQGCAARRSGRDAALFLEAWRVDQITLDFDELITTPTPATPEATPEPTTAEVTATAVSG